MDTNGTPLAALRCSSELLASQTGPTLSPAFNDRHGGGCASGHPQRPVRPDLRSDGACPAARSAVQRHRASPVSRSSRQLVARGGCIDSRTWVNRSNRLRTAATSDLAAQERSVSRKTVAEVPLTGLSLKGSASCRTLASAIVWRMASWWAVIETVIARAAESGSPAAAARLRRLPGLLPAGPPPLSPLPAGPPHRPPPAWRCPARSA